MLVHVDHEIRYTYSRPVVLEPHAIRLKPRSDPFHTVVESNLCISPDPSGLSEILDIEGTSTYMAWFLGKTDTLTIRCSSSIRLYRRDPFDFIVYPFMAQKLPVIYPDTVHWRLHQELAPLTNDPHIFAYAESVADETNSETLPFLTHLAKKIAGEWSYIFRETGDPYTPHETFEKRAGSCRDLAILYIAMCRYMGIASRFVSGYFYDPDLTGPPQLHAWAEAYIPGGGWRGFDPTNAVAVQGRHVAIAAGCDSGATMPVYGTFRGDAHQTMSAQVQLRDD